MAHIVKISDEYFVEYWAQGLKFQKKGGPERAIAEALLQKIKQSVPENIEDIYRVRSDFFEDVVTAYDVYLKRNVHTITSNRLLAVVNDFRHYLCAQENAKTIQDVTPRIVNDYLKNHLAHGESEKWMAVRFHLLKLFFDYAIGFGAINDNPLLHLNVLKKNYFYCPQVFSDDQLAALIAAESIQARRMMILLVATTGLSCAQLMRLRVDYFNIKEKRLSLGQRRWPVDGRFIAWLTEQSDKECLFDHSDVLQFNSIYNQTTLRNTFARMILSKGVSLIQLCDYLQEKNILRVLPYSHFIKTEPLN